MLTQKYLGARGKSEKSSQRIASLLCSIAFYSSREKQDKAFDGPFRDVVLLLYWQIKQNYFSKNLPCVVFFQLRSTLEIQNGILEVVCYHSHLSWERKKCSFGCTRCLVWSISHYILTVSVFSLEVKYQILRIYSVFPYFLLFSL